MSPPSHTGGNAKEQRLRLLIIGGYGTFGGRLAELLCRERRVSLVIAGRSKSAALAFCHALPPGAAREALAVDRNGDVTRRIEKVNPDIVVDASGPFQSYGKDPYRVVKAALATRTHYLDLADSPDFVRGIRQFDGAAREQGLVVLSGVSSFPVLSAALVRDLATDFRSIDSITGGIAPSPYAGVGYNVIRAIAGYAGKGIPVRRQGSEETARALRETRRFTIAPPGEIPLFPRKFSLVDVPDLQLLADEWPEVRDVWMGAAPEPSILHWLLRRFAGLVRLGLVPSLAPLARLIHSTANNVRWGEHRGGMFVEVGGRDAEGADISRSAHLLAEGHHGLYIPSMAVEAIVRNWLDGRLPTAGARPATAELALSDYARVFADRPIAIGTRNGARAGEQCLHARILGTAWQALPAALRAVHVAGPKLTISGAASITRGRGVLARLLAWIMRFPAAGENIPVAVTFERHGHYDKWTRDFGGQEFSSTFTAGSGRYEHLLCERFGPLTFGMALVPDADRLNLVMRGWSLLGLPLPRSLMPSGDSYEYAKDGRFCFDVEVRLPLAGFVIRYRGFLAPPDLFHDPSAQTPSASSS
ncbi:MAG: DUF4166 domain-containing protein [Gammaproteobacteria bacterium]|nr:DUF4166 domain-containing protein [Gammaproteobacteria bacterium]MDE0413678.1 DUF4166 domain-containing protein [Gammaproteobacteria bacterium]